ncbi:hypothetical protein C8F01DRAFT_4069 [Mycena amicta]|nr:hypothetical protein C8F01DRAFT_4069 [Mycena amicta]
MDKANNSVWSVSKYLSYGTLSIAIQPNGFQQIRRDSADDPVAEDGWAVFTPKIIKHIKNPDDYPTVQGLEFLMSRKFVYASYFAITNDILVVRIYTIPYDLPGVQGKLRTRPENVVATARRLLADLLPKLSRSVASWDGQVIPEAPPSTAGTTLSGLYEDLPSPSGHITAVATPITRRLLTSDDELGNFGLRSTLHRYQRRSVAAMVQKEMDLRVEPDPLFLAIKGMNGQEFYFQPGTMEVLMERPMVEPCRGGILCEELGTGKTVMCLSLILATMNQISAPEPSILDTRPILTPLAFRHFTSPEYSAARTRFFLHTRKAAPRTQSQRPVPSLTELLLHKLAVDPILFTPESRTSEFERNKEAFDNLEQYAAPKRDNLPFYLDYQGEPVDNERLNRRGSGQQKQAGPFMLYLTSASLVVVPKNLLLQWSKEIELHCRDHVRFHVVQEGKKIPPASELASQYDIILMSYSTFTAEDKKPSSNSKSRAWTGCACPEYPHVRVPQCVCKPPDCSPLLQVRWKRLIIDEGHVAATLESVLTGFTKALSVERRWIVSGTPTTNLLGLSLGNLKNAEVQPQVDENENENEMVVSESTSMDSSRATSPFETPESQSTDVSSSSSSSTGPRIWTREDGEDLRKLGNMIAQFVGVPQLLANPSLIDTHIKDPLLNGKGNARRAPRPGAIDVLKQLMASTMIRHRIADVEEEVKLPPVTHDLVFLNLHPLAVKSYNALQASIAINAVTSERKDQDYMFHAQNVAFLAEAMQNMSQILFWSVDENLYNAVDNIMDGGAGLRRRIKPTTSAEDVALLEDAIRRFEIAFDDPLWRVIQTHEDVPYLVSGLSKPIFDAWSRTAAAQPDVDTTDGGGYIHPDRMRKLRELVLRKPLISENHVLQAGLQVVEEDAEWRALYKKSEKRKRKGKGKSGGPQAAYDGSGSRKAKAAEAIKKATDANTVMEMRKDLERAIGVELGMNPISETTTKNAQSVLMAQSHIAHTRLGTTASSKLNFIVNEVLKYSPTEKFLIFSDSVLTLAHIGEALELIGVHFLRFSTEITADVRKQYVMTFETSEKYRVFLMELKHGARGLNLTKASRVIFCEPVWRPDVESQAIKRCHRIGQTRSITVKTLAIRGTAEENMAARRRALQDVEKMPKLIEEAGFRAFIANPKFLPETPLDGIPQIDVPLVKLELAPGDVMDDVDMDVDPREGTPPSSPFAAMQLTTPLVRVRPKNRFADDDAETSIDAPSPSKRQKVDTSPRRVKLTLPDPDSPTPSTSRPAARRVRFS